MFEILCIPDLTENSQHSLTLISAKRMLLHVDTFRKKCVQFVEDHSKETDSSFIWESFHALSVAFLFLTL